MQACNRPPPVPTPAPSRRPSGVVRSRSEDERVLMRYHPIHFAQKLALVEEPWRPRVVAEMNGYQFKIVKL
jgi:hypothetical protein